MKQALSAGGHGSNCGVDYVVENICFMLLEVFVCFVPWHGVG
jgi:hypothetical protein